MGRDKQYPPSEQMIEDATNLLENVSLLEEALGVEFILTGGFRPEEMIEDHELPGCPHDAHSRAQGIDIHDPDLFISKLILQNLDLLEQTGLWMESPVSAKDHLHLQSYAPGSGKRVFIA